MHFLTIHNHADVLDKTIDDLESLSPRRPSLVLRESVQPLKDCLDVLLSETLLDIPDCIAFSKVTFQRERTHSLVPDSARSSPERAWKAAPSLFSPPRRPLRE